MRRVLGLAAFRRLLIGTILNELASSIGSVALSLLVYRRTGSALGAAGFFLCSQFGPALASPLFVARLDQRSARRVLVSIYALEAIVFAVLAWVAGRFSLVPVLVLALVDGILALTARVLARAAWTTITSAVGLLREAQALNNTSFTLAFMAGPAVGGAVVALGGTVAALLVNTGVFAAVAVVILATRGLPPPVAEPSPVSGRVRAALRTAWGRPVIRRLLTLQTVGIVFFTISVPVEVVFAQHSLHTSAAGYGGLLSAWGAGAVAGSAIYARWRAASSRAMIVLGTVALGIGFAVMAGAPSLAVALVGAAIAGAGNGIQLVAVRTALQEATPEAWMAMVVSLNESIFQAVPGVGIILGGGIAAAAGPRVALAVGAAGSLAVAVAMRLRLPAETRQEPPEPAPSPGLGGPDASLATATRHQ